MSNKTGIDPEALIEMFATASAKQAAQLREAVSTTTLKALEGRELTLKNIRAVVRTVTKAASQGAAQNATPGLDVETMLATAVAGVDDALLQAVDANRVAMTSFVEQGVSLQEKHLKKAMDDLEKMEDAMLGTMRKATEGLGPDLAGPWSDVLAKFQAMGSKTGNQAHATLDQLSQQTLSAMRDTRRASMKATQTLADSYTAMVSGVLIGLSDAMRQGAAAQSKPAAKTARK